MGVTEITNTYGKTGTATDNVQVSYGNERLLRDNEIKGSTMGQDTGADSLTSNARQGGK